MALALPAAASAAQAKPPPYPEAMRCAALTQAANKIGKDTPQSSQLFDHVIYWGMAAADAGRAAGKGSNAVDVDVSREAGPIEAKLRAQDAATTAALANCVSRVVPLDE